MLQTVDDVIKALGETQKAADLLGVVPSAVSNWKARGKFPSDKFLAITAVLKDRGKRVSPVLFGFVDQPESAR
jgi:DNA-binding transcriptional regulator YdaS (Cro superfamily)